jgi:hypothetical protein
MPSCRTAFITHFACSRRVRVGFQQSPSPAALALPKVLCQTQSPFFMAWVLGSASAPSISGTVDPSKARLPSCKSSKALAFAAADGMSEMLRVRTKSGKDLAPSPVCPFCHSQARGVITGCYAAQCCVH